MTIQHRHWKPACAVRAWRLCFCIGLMLMSAGFVRAETIGASAYDSWRWGGFIQSSAAETTAQSVSILNSSTALSALSASAEATTTAANGYNSWQWGGFARSYSSASSSAITTTTVSEILASSETTKLAAGAAEETEITTSLSGYVFYDENENGVMETTDWAILDAKVSLTKQGSGEPAIITYTDADGAYTFTDLSAGAYTIAMLTPCSTPGMLILGTLYDADGHAVSDAGKAGDDCFYDIVLKDGYQGINYIFGESEYPAAAVSKRLLINGGPKHAPEPSTLVLLAIAGMTVGLYARRKK